MIHRLEMMKETLMNCVQGQMGDLASANTEELGDAIDMIKDLSEAIYYCTITKSMSKENEYGDSKYYPMPLYDNDHRYYGGSRDIDKRYGKLYYDGDRGNSQAVGVEGRRNYPIEIRDYREGMSPMTRKTYMERKMHGGSKEMQMQELEKYMHELTNDITEMIEGASMEEKQMLQKKISALATKIV